MQNLIVWFRREESELCRQMAACTHEVDAKHPNPYHLESDCWSHTMMVCKLASLSGYSTNVQTAALLHDIGKPASRRVNPRNRHVRFSGHESLSARMSEPILLRMARNGLIPKESSPSIRELIALHTLLHGEIDPLALAERFRQDPFLFRDLAHLNRCDALGSFSIMPTWGRKREEKLQKIWKLLGGEGEIFAPPRPAFQSPKNRVWL